MDTLTYLRNKNKEVKRMSKELFVKAEEVARELGISKPYAYKLVRVIKPFCFSASFISRTSL